MRNGGLVGGLASVETHGEQTRMRNGGLVGGLASVETNGEQMRNGGLASRMRRNEDEQHTTERLWKATTPSMRLASGLVCIYASPEGSTSPGMTPSNSEGKWTSKSVSSSK
jgi:hypothetical protein